MTHLAEMLITNCDRPYLSNVVAEAYTKGTAATAQDVTATTDKLTLDQFYDVLMYFDDVKNLLKKIFSTRICVLT